MTHFYYSNTALHGGQCSMMRRYVGAVLRHPLAIVLTVLAVSIGATFMLLQVFQMSCPECGQYVRDSAEASRLHALYQGFEAVADSWSDDGRQPQQTEYTSRTHLDVYYVAGRSHADDQERSLNLLTVETIRRIAVLEDRILNQSGWSRVCLRDENAGECGAAYSAIPYLRDAADDEALQLAVATFYAECNRSKLERPFEAIDDADWFFESPTGGARKGPSRNASYLLRSRFRFGEPLEGYYNVDDRQGSQRSELLDSFLSPLEAEVLRGTASEWSSGAVAGAPGSLFWSQQQLYEKEFTQIIWKDLLLTLGSLGSIFLIMAFHLGSAVLALAGVIQVLLSFPVALYIYRMLAGLTLFGVLQAMAIFVIAGIGADDVFVLSDALLAQPLDVGRRESRRESESRRFEAAFRRAFSAMLTTTTTTAVAFALTASIKVPTVRYFAVFTCVLILVNFALVCSLYLASLVLWDRHVRHRPSQHHDRSTAAKPNAHAAPAGGANGGGSAAPAESSAPAEPPARRSRLRLRLRPRALFRRVCTEQLGPALVRHRRVLLVFSAALALAHGVGAAILVADSVRAESAVENRNPYWPDEHPLGRRWYLELNALWKTPHPVDVLLYLGIEGIDRSHADVADDEDLGTAVWYPNFDLGATESQRFLLSLCEAIEAEAEVLSVKPTDDGEPHDCLSAQLRDWRLARQQSYPMETSHFLEQALEFRGRRAAEDVGSQLGVELSKAGRVIPRFHALRFETLVGAFDSDARVERLRDAWTAFVRNQTDSSPASLGAVRATSRTFLFRESLAQARVAAGTSVALSLLMAFLVLVAFTRNWRISLLATLNIAVIVTSAFGAIGFYGWQLNVFESVCITVLCGFTLDYTLHLAVAYMEEKQTIADRRARAANAVSTIGLSVIAGAVSTLCAACFLQFALIVFLQRFGTFVLTAVALAATFALFTFVPLAACFGPQGREGEIDLAWLLPRRLLPRSSTLQTSASAVHVGDQSGSPSPSSESPVAVKGAGAANGTCGSRMANGAHGENLIGACNGSDEGIAACIGPNLMRAPQPLLKAMRARAAGEKSSTLCLLTAPVLVLVALAGGTTRLLTRSTEAATRTPDDAQYLPPIDSLEPGRWHTLVPAGDTMCARGTPFAFFVRPGDRSRVIVEFMGGGACWSERTCGQRAATFRDSVVDTRERYERFGVPTTSDIAPGESDYLLYSGLSDADGHFSNWTHVYVPYCTGDLHWGDADVTYAEGLTVHHRGARNAHAAMQWLMRELPSAPNTTALVTGCSAGAYASLYWAAQLIPHFEANGGRVVQFGDSGMGIVSDSFLNSSYLNWNATGHFAWQIIPPALAVDRSNEAMSQFTLLDMYRFASEYYPEHSFSQYSSAYDNNQAFFLAVTQDDDQRSGEPTLAEKLAWAERMREQYGFGETLAAPNYAQFIGAGDEHCVLPFNRFWWTQAGGHHLHEWLTASIERTAQEGSRYVDCSPADTVNTPSQLLPGCSRGVESTGGST